jgi:membrane protein
MLDCLKESSTKMLAKLRPRLWAEGLHWSSLWKSRLIRLYTCFNDHRIPEISAGATFFVLLAIFPAFTSVVTLYGLFADRTSIAHVLELVSRFLPRGALIVLNAELHRLIAQDIPKLGLTFLLSTLIAIWSASGGLKAVISGLNIAYEVAETRRFFRRSLLAFAFTAAAIVMAVIAIALATVMPLVSHQLPFNSFLRSTVPILGWPMAFGLSLVILAGIYTYGPNRVAAWRWFTWGGALSSCMWLAGTLMFKWYVRNFGNFDRVYGNLGAVVGFLVWIWLSLMIVLIGAELNRLLEQEYSRGTRRHQQATDTSHEDWPDTSMI